MLKGKSALVTGSTSGIGLGIARGLAAQGANITINGFGDKDAIEKERSGIQKDFGVEALYSPADMTKPAEIAAMVQTSQQRFGSLDILVNNAGVQFVSPIEDFPIEKWDQIIAINLTSAFHAVRAAVPIMKAAGQARHSRPDQDRGAGGGARRDHLQRHLPRIRQDAPGRGADRRPGQGAPHD